MSQPIGKKPRFEIPPLNWKAPGTHPNPVPPSRPEHAEPASEQIAIRVPA